MTQLIFLYGAGEAQKRTALLKIRQSYPSEQVKTVDLTHGLSELETALRFQPLFSSGGRLVIAENPPDNFSFNALPDDVVLVVVAGALRADHQLIKSARKAGATVTCFEGEKELNAFPFLDSLIERKQTAFLELDKLLDEYGGIYVLTMIYYLLRRNLLPLPSSSFYRQKVLSQKKAYQLSDWTRFYQMTLETEFAIKNGETEERIALTKLVQRFITEGCDSRAVLTALPKTSLS